MNTRVLIASLALFVCAATAHAEDFKAQVVQIEGSAKSAAAGQLRQGAVLETSDKISLDSGASVSIALDGDLKNLVHLTGPASVEILSLYPTHLRMDKGDLLAKLDALPEESSFEIETPIGIAAVRGTEFRATYGDEGLEVFNLSPSDVFVFNKDLSGRRAETPVRLGQTEKSGVKRAGAAPAAPQRIPEGEFRRQAQVQQKLAGHIQGARGFKPTLPPIAQIRQDYQKHLNEFKQNGSVPGPDGRPSKARGEAFGRMEKLREGFDKTPRPANAQAGDRPTPQESGQGQMRRPQEPGQQGQQGPQGQPQRPQVGQQEPQKNQPQQQQQGPRLGQHRPHQPPAEGGQPGQPGKDGQNGFKQHRQPQQHQQNQQQNQQKAQPRPAGPKRAPQGESK